jgi:tetratricopeptide (TPR) repeat protein
MGRLALVDLAHDEEAEIRVASYISRPTGRLIEAAIAGEQWREARKLIERSLKSEPESHWLLTRLSLTYYEEFAYARALEYSQKALTLAPDCPLVHWDYAGALRMLNRPREAIKIYDRILRRDVESLASHECGEGKARARGLRADTLYMVARCHRTLGNRIEAARFVRESLRERGPGCASIYPIAELRKFAATLTGVIP